MKRAVFGCEDLRLCEVSCEWSDLWYAMEHVAEVKPCIDPPSSVSQSDSEEKTEAEVVAEEETETETESEAEAEAEKAAAGKATAEVAEQAAASEKARLEEAARVKADRLRLEEAARAKTEKAAQEEAARVAAEEAAKEAERAAAEKAAAENAAAEAVAAAEAQAAEAAAAAERLRLEDAARKQAQVGAQQQQQQQQQQQPVVTKAQGFDLHLSDRSNSGYKHVYAGKPSRKGRRFEAKVRRSGGGVEHLGYFATAVEAAVAYAKAVTPAPTPPTLPDRSPSLGRKKQQQQQQPVVTKAQGFDLHLSDRSNSGYKHVYAGKPSRKGRRFEAKVRRSGGGVEHLGYFATAVEAAVAYAKAVAPATTPPTLPDRSPSLGRKRFRPDARTYEEGLPPTRSRRLVQRLGHNDDWGHRRVGGEGASGGGGERADRCSGGGAGEEERGSADATAAAGEALVAEGGGGRGGGGGGEGGGGEEEEEKEAAAATRSLPLAKSVAGAVALNEAAAQAAAVAEKSTLPGKVEMLKVSLGIDTDKTMGEAVQEASEILGLPYEGRRLIAQVDALISLLFKKPA